MSGDDFQRDRVIARAAAGDQLSETEQRILETSEHAPHCRCYLCRGEQPRKGTPVHHDHVGEYYRESQAELRKLRADLKHYRWLALERQPELILELQEERSRERSRARAHLAAFVLASWERLSWRRHGIGLAQAYVREGEGSKTRVHVWHPDLVRPGIADHGDIHDHRFSFVSTVLVGAITNRVAHVRENADGAYQVHQVRHARINPEGAFVDLKRSETQTSIRTESPMRVVPGPLDAHATFVDVDFEEQHLSAGQSYRFARGAFHCTRADDLAVTVVTKFDQLDAGARILALRDSPPVPAFDPRDALDRELGARMLYVLECARSALERAEGTVCPIARSA